MGPPPPVTVSSAPVIGLTPWAWQAQGELHRSPEAVVVGQRQRPVAELGGAQRELVGLEAPSRNEKAEWAWSST